MVSVCRPAGRHGRLHCRAATTECKSRMRLADNVSLSTRAAFGSFLKKVVIFALFLPQHAANWPTKRTNWAPT